METEPSTMAGEAEPGPVLEIPGRSLLLRVTCSLVSASAAIYLLNTLGDVLRPVFIAVLLCYAIMPLRTWLQRYLRPSLAMLIIVLGLISGSYVIGRMVYINVSAVWKDMPIYQARAESILDQIERFTDEYVPALSRTEPRQPIEVSLKKAEQYLGHLLTLFANFAAEAMVVGLYMIFLMEEAARFPSQIRAAFPPGRSTRILDVSRSINEGVIDYLSVKVKVNLLVALPATLLMLAFGLEGAVLWGVLTFFGRFVPYLGSVVTCAVPLALASLQFQSLTKAVVFALLLIAIHVLIEYVIEPVMTGKAVGLSPLAVMLALSFWGLTWGIVGMCLAVPMMVIFKIVLAHLPATRPVARMISHGEH